ncbi:polysaccharide biosynthesis tyrosine autokinase [Actinomycetospora rhizophila]|uniref:Polysaccharide biosynthesis tyrosine autokinase n=1 Tax=Actinomycetospora rhizophila TaxID=1416876 RepID=A0ABV9ZL75_9PSEU
MELRDYLRMLRRGWATILLVTMLGVTIASIYIALAPKRFESSTALFVTTANPATIDDLQQGSNFSSTAVVTYAQIIDSSTVLDPVSTELRPQRNVDDLVGAVSASVREDTTLIDIGAAASDPRSAAAIANATADSAVRIIPTLQTRPDGLPLIRIQQIRPAAEPVTAASPDAPRILAIGLVVGLFVGLAGTIVRQSTDPRVQRADDLRSLTEVPVVATLPSSRGARNGIVARDAPSSPLGEAYRTLRTTIESLDPQRPRSIMFAAASGDSAVQVPANLAWTFAQSGRRVVLVDLDLRARAIAEAFSVNESAGISDLLIGHADLDDVVRSTTNPKLDVITSGAEHAVAPDLLGSEVLRGMFRRLERDYDIAVLHAPAVLALADAAMLAGAVGGTFLVVRAGRTRSEDVSSALETLANVRVRPLGLVLTDVRGPEAIRSTGAVPGPSPGALDSPTLRQRPPSAAGPRTTQVSQPRRTGPGVRPNWTG